MANKNRFWCSPTVEMQEAFIKKYGTKINNEYVLGLIAKDLEIDTKNVNINRDLIRQFVNDSKQEFCCHSICEALGYNGINQQQKVAKYLSLLEKDNIIATVKHDNIRGKFYVTNNMSN